MRRRAAVTTQSSGLHPDRKPGRTDRKQIPPPWNTTGLKQLRVKVQAHRLSLNHSPGKQHKNRHIATAVPIPKYNDSTLKENIYCVFSYQIPSL